MSLERTILLAVWAFVIILLGWLWFKSSRRDVILLFCAGQCFTWSASLLFVELKWIENPIREFSKATSANFTFNYVLYPTLNVIYSLKYPRNGTRFRKWLHIAKYPAAMTVFILIIAKYTRLIKLTSFTWYELYLVTMISLFMVRKYYEWFRRSFPEALKEPVQ